MDMWVATCEVCDWQNKSADEPSLRRSAIVHGLITGMHYSTIERVPGGWVR